MLPSGDSNSYRQNLQIFAATFTCIPFLCGFDPADGIRGRVTRQADGRYAIDATIDRTDGCAGSEHVTGLKRGGRTPVDD